MAKLGVFSTEQKKWIQFDEDTEVLIKHVGKKELDEIGDKSRKQAKLSGMDLNAIHNQRLGKVAVLGWRKIKVIDPAHPELVPPDHPGFIVNDAPLPFSPENVSMLMANSLDFSNFVNENSIKAKEFLSGVEETKNAS